MDNNSLGWPVRFESHCRATVAALALDRLSREITISRSINEKPPNSKGRRGRKTEGLNLDVTSRPSRLDTGDSIVLAQDIAAM